MTVEYLVLLAMSGIIIAGAFGFNKGPVPMLQQKAPYLGYLIEERMESGMIFQEKSDPGGNWRPANNPI